MSKPSVSKGKVSVFGLLASMILALVLAVVLEFTNIAISAIEHDGSSDCQDGSGSFGGH